MPPGSLTASAYPRDEPDKSAIVSDAEKGVMLAVLLHDAFNVMKMIC
ncbi:hypothetical protein PC129_g14766 [Phytophthora cactorum]|uniref:Uncharacterized protein n=1 Tax=Phytophthora cactorum TaxID=29920 RepID=A0A8T1KEF4_9STRA|nr:hypothetical protein PC112_g11258 [Phytophthora cactorum]KAG2889463.1 hypothetical protein PC114_g17936 [Phytophthora cactorum]KAG2917428.1 hypothetical protein PC117_g17443 [Phytophthora cactorum]KAG2999096.1 hypothetical protein PC119_g17306 [Phytophthora cactorum]KAG3071242.1 hypothetical protein PC122_g15736 [Phytophthora cactorum]